MGGSRSRPSRPVELEESPTSRSFTRQVPFNDEEPASPSSPPWTPLGPVSPGTGSLSLGGRQFFGRSSGPSSPEPSPLSPKSQSSKSSRPFLARSWSALSLGGKKDEPQELTEFLRQVPLLKCLPRAKVSFLTEVAGVQKFPPGSDVVRQGEEGATRHLSCVPC
ncbi:unnamed protein product [Durusdinium trenchii]|uniref:Cyclic nucleotide-binding domain-containing protein n=1 Tax=Durusdinium trenchii TaxID=1381693 RepID=A0ABP0NTP6_9DINO